MADLLNRFGPVVDIGGLDVEQITKALSAYEPDGMATYLDAGMVDLRPGGRRPAAAVPQPRRRRRPHRQVVASARCLAEPACPCRPATWSGPTSPSGTWRRSSRRWAGPLSSSPGRPREAATPSWPTTRPNLAGLLEALGPGRPDMVLEGYLADDPARAEAAYAAYVSVESVVAAGVISHLALTGRFPLAENFRETGFFIPAALDDADREAVLQSGHPGHRGPRRPHRLPPHRGQVHPRRARASSRSTVGSAAACRRCSIAPPAFPFSS